MNENHEQPTWVDADTLAELFATSRPTIFRWAREGMPRLGHGKYPLAGCVQWRCQKLEELASERRDKIINLDEKRAELIEQQTRKARLENAILEGSHVAIADVENNVTDMITAARARLLAIPHKLAPLVAAQAKAAICQDLIETAIHEALDEVADAGSAAATKRRSKASATRLEAPAEAES